MLAVINHCLCKLILCLSNHILYMILYSLLVSQKEPEDGGNQTPSCILDMQCNQTLN